MNSRPVWAKLARCHLNNKIKTSYLGHSPSGTFQHKVLGSVPSTAKQKPKRSEKAQEKNYKEKEELLAQYFYPLPFSKYFLGKDLKSEGVPESM
jgi:hypothetical protein